MFGRDLLSNIRLDWPQISGALHAVRHDSVLDVFSEFSDIFSDSLGCISGHEADIRLRSDANPKCVPSRPVPYAIRPLVDRELDRLEKDGIVKKVDSAEWSSPIVVVHKKNGEIRLCADFKVSINKFIDPQQYPIPNPTDLLSSLAGGKVFSKLDLRQAYAQLKLSESSQKYCVISTHRGLYAYTRLPFGVASAPSIWQRVIEQIVQGIPGVCVYFDDLLVSAESQADHDFRMRQVMERFRKHGVRLSRDKCVLCQQEVSYLGYTISGEGIQPNDDKVRAILVSGGILFLCSLLIHVMVMQYTFVLLSSS